MSFAMDLSIIIVSYNTASLLRQAITAVREASRNLLTQTIIVDNASRDDSVDMVKREFPDCSLILNSVNVGFGRANNQALPMASGRYVLLLNSDAFVSPDTIEKTVAYMDGHSKCGILGVKLVGRNGEPQPSARHFPNPWNLFLWRTGLNRFFGNVQMVDDNRWDGTSPCQCDWVTGCYFLIRREVIDQVGLFDPRYFLYYEELDHCFAAKRSGWEVHCYPYTTVIHIGGESAKSDGEISASGRQLVALEIESEMLYFRKNLGRWALALNVFLVTLGGILNVLKRVLRWKRPFGITELTKQMGMVWRTLFQTKFGRCPTR
jgi:N-acetylglucosaminyl-diphospho-decaprenol L-rhamnosyltransferase